MRLLSLLDFIIKWKECLRFLWYWLEERVERTLGTTSLKRKAKKADIIQKILANNTGKYGDIANKKPAKQEVIASKEKKKAPPFPSILANNLFLLGDSGIESYNRLD